VHEQQPAARGGGPASAANAGGGGGEPPSRARPVTIGFSAPAADHGWIAAIAANAQAQAEKYSDVTFAPVNPTNDITQQIAAIDT
jgi:ribose transport system substrate-binding protein